MLSQCVFQPPFHSAGQGLRSSFGTLRALCGNAPFQTLVRAAAQRCSDGAFSQPLPAHTCSDLRLPSLLPSLQGALSGILSAVPADELQPLLETLGDVRLVELMLRLHGDLLPDECRGSPLEEDARRVMSMLVSLLPDMLEPHMRRQLRL